MVFDCLLTTDSIEMRAVLLVLMGEPFLRAHRELFEEVGLIW